MNEMLPEETQIAKALNPWLRLNSPSFCDRDSIKVCILKVCRETTVNQQKKKKKKKTRCKKREGLRMWLRRAHHSICNYSSYLKLSSILFSLVFVQFT